MTPAPAYRRGLVFWSFAAIYIVWGSTYLAIRLVVESLPPLLAGGLRFVVAGALLYGWTRWKGVPAPNRAQWKHAFLLGALFFMIGNGGISWAETRIPSGLTALLAATSPLFVQVYTSAMGGWKRPPLRVIVGVIAGLGGVALLVAPGELIGGAHADLLGAAAITLSAMSWAGASVLSHARPLHGSPALGTGMKMLAGGVLLLIAGAVFGEVGQLHAGSFSLKAMLALLYLLVFGSLIGFSAFTYLLRVTTPAMVSTSAYVNPLTAVVLGWAILGEAITVRTVLAAAIIIGGVMLIRLKAAEPSEPGTE